MRRAGMLATLTLAFHCSGCVVISLHPLWSNDVIVRDARLEGTWVALDPRWEGGPCIWKFAPASGDGYQVRITQSKDSTALKAMLVQIGESRYLDLQPLPAEEGPSTIQAHAFMRLRVEQDRLFVEGCDRDKLEAAMKKYGGAIDAESIDNGKRLVLTSRTPALQAFFKEHGDEVMGSSFTLHRKAEEGGR